MNSRAFILTLFSSLFTFCNNTFLINKDYVCKLKDLSWNLSVEGVVGEVYLKDSNLIYGRNYDSLFIEISIQNGTILKTLHPYTIEKERTCTMLDSGKISYKGYSLQTIKTDQKVFSSVVLKVFDRQFRGDDETNFLIFTKLSGKTFTLLFHRNQFSSITDIFFVRDGKFAITYDGESGSDKAKYINHIGLLDINKIFP